MTSTVSATRFELLSKDNYEAWKIHVEALLIKNDLWEYVSGDKPIPVVVEGNQASIDARNEWIRTDRKAKSEVILAISSTELQHVRGCNTSREVWQKLASVYASKGPARKALLLKQLMLHKMSEGGDVRDHVNKFSDIVDRLGAMDIEVNKDLLSVMLLYSLPDSYEGFKCAMESRDELLGVEALKVKILEKSEVGSNSVIELAGSVRAENQLNYKNDFKGYCFKCGKQGHKSPECPVQSKPNFRRNGPDKQNRQYRQEKQCAQADDDTFAVYNTEFAGSIPSCRPWILDSGCTTHLCGDKQLFKSFNGETNGRINLANQASSEIKGKGTVNLLISNGNQLRSVDFSNTLFVPDLRSNLVSVAKITNKDHEVLFRKDLAVIMDMIGNVKFVAERRGNLYYLQEGNEEAGIVEDKASSEFLMWHCRMGHLNANDLVQVINQNTTSKATPEQLTCLSKCEVCLRGKMTRLPFLASERQSEEILEIVHTDIVGPFRTQSVNGAKYFITFIDDRSRWCEVYFLKQKSGALEAFKMYQTQVERVTGKKIKYLQSDNGKEYCNAEMDTFLRNQGIQRRLSVVRTPQQNGVAERFNRTLVEMARCLLLQSNLSDMFWADAVATACHLRNRCPSRSINGDTPYQRWFNRDKMSLNYLRAFGSTVYVLDKDPAKGKLSDRSMKGIFIGYPRETKGYRIWLPESRRFIVARDVKFIEDNVTTILKDQKIKQLIVNDFENKDKPWVELITGLGNNNETETPVEITEENLEDNEENENSSGILSSIYETPRRESREETKEERRGPGRPKLIKTGLRGRPRKLFSKANNCEFKERIGCDLNEDDNINMFAGVAEVQLNDAMNSPESSDWKRAIQSEVMSLLKNDTWDIVKLSDSQSVVGSRMILTNKFESDGLIEKRKARIVAKGYSQKYGIDYNQTFAPVARMESMRLLFGLSAELNLEVRQFDVVTAYLNGTLDETVFMEIPDMLHQALKWIIDDSQVSEELKVKAMKMLKCIEEGGDVCKLKKALYGLKQAARQWHEKLSSKLESIGLKSTKAESCMYYAKRGKDILLLLIYVDDFLIASSDICWIDEIKCKLQDDFEIKDLGAAKQCLGLEINQTDQYIFINQSRYIINLLKKYEMYECNPVKTPGELQNKKVNNSIENEEIDNGFYREIIGALMYLVVGTRPDIANTVSRLAQFVNKPCKQNWLGVKRILRYLAGTTKLGIFYTKKTKPMIGYCDADWGGCLEDRRSYSGYVFILAGGAVSWKSQKQRTVALSSTESEYVSLSEAVKEAIYLKGLLTELQQETFSKIELLIDNRGAEQLASNPVYHARTKHIDIRHHFVREAVENEIVKLRHVSSSEMVADILTKALPRELHDKCIQGLGLEII